MEGCHYICIVAPAFAHSGYAKLLKGHLHKDQIVVTFPGAFSALVLKNVFGDDPDCPVFADANNLPYDARLVEKGSDTVNVFGRNPINIAFLPAEKGPALINEMREDLFPFEKIYTDVLECGLAIVNPDWHAGPVLFNISRIESPQVNFFLYEHGWTPSACRLNIAMDKERKAIGEVLGYNLRPMEDFAGRPEDYKWTWQDLYKEGHGLHRPDPHLRPQRHRQPLSDGGHPLRPGALGRHRGDSGCSHAPDQRLYRHHQRGP